MKYLISELEGAPLDAAVALAEGEDPRMVRSLRYSKSWRDAGRIIERERLWLSCADADDGGEWVASFSPHTEHSIGDGPPEVQRIFTGPTPLIAAMRAYVASKFGDEVELPR